MEFSSQFNEVMKQFRSEQWERPDWLPDAPRSADDLNDPRKARGWCGDVSQKFADFMSERGHEVGVEAGRLPGHLYNTHEGMTIDWTARQVWPDADVPHIEHEDSYIARHPWEPSNQARAVRERMRRAWDDDTSGR